MSVDFVRFVSNLNRAGGIRQVFCVDLIRALDLEGDQLKVYRPSPARGHPDQPFPAVSPCATATHSSLPLCWQAAEEYQAATLTVLQSMVMVSTGPLLLPAFPVCAPPSSYLTHSAPSGVASVCG